MGGLVALDEAWKALSLHRPPQPVLRWIHIFLAVLAVSVAMLGPGAWSIDARLFGRKRFDIDRTRGRRPLPLNGEEHPQPSRDLIEIDLGTHYRTEKRQNHGQKARLTAFGSAEARKR